MVISPECLDGLPRCTCLEVNHPSEITMKKRPMVTIILHEEIGIAARNVVGGCDGVCIFIVEWQEGEVRKKFDTNINPTGKQIGYIHFLRWLKAESELSSERV